VNVALVNILGPFFFEITYRLPHHRWPPICRPSLFSVNVSVSVGPYFLRSPQSKALVLPKLGKADFFRINGLIDWVDDIKMAMRTDWLI
jgi:hypothetical protein